MVGAGWTSGAVTTPGLLLAGDNGAPFPASSVVRVGLLVMFAEVTDALRSPENIPISARTTATIAIIFHTGG